MNIYISTNLYNPDQLEEIFSLLDKINDRSIGIELFVEWQNDVFIKFIDDNIDRLKDYKISLHGPYYETEHSAEKGSLEYIRTNEYFNSTLEISKELNSRYIVYHHNNCKVVQENKERMIEASSENLIDLNENAKEYDSKIVVENCGVISHENMLFNEKEFIEMAKSIPNNILIDIGHAFANKWYIENIIMELKDKIVAYHIHNNDGFEDNHNRINDGKLSFDKFLDLYKKYTSDADLVLEYGKQCYKDVFGIIEDIEYIKNKLNK